MSGRDELMALLQSRVWGEWTGIDCGCCYGLEWGGEYPRECRTCGGSGVLWLSPSGTRLAQYPGGPFAGVADEGDRKQARELRSELEAMTR